MSTIAEIEKQIEVVKAALRVWPEKRREYTDALFLLKGKLGRYKHYRNTQIARSYVIRKGKDIDKIIRE